MGDDRHLYLMLLRFASLVIETIPRHRDFRRTNPPAEHRQLERVILHSVITESISPAPFYIDLTPAERHNTNLAQRLVNHYQLKISYWLVIFNGASASVGAIPSCAFSPCSC